MKEDAFSEEIVILANIHLKVNFKSKENNKKICFRFHLRYKHDLNAISSRKNTEVFIVRKFQDFCIPETRQFYTE